MAPRATLSDAARKLRRHRLEMELALAEGISLDAARHRLFEQRLADITARRLERDRRLTPVATALSGREPAPGTLWYRREDL